jgi:hypothetical protein
MIARLFFIFSWLTCFAAASAAQSAHDSTSLSDSSATRIDSLRTQTLDPAYAWKGWPDIERATALRPLDGPDDILEKKEIIEDRLDDLHIEEKKLRTVIEGWHERQQALEMQREVLDDLAEVQRGGDLQLQQRLHTLREDMRQIATRIKTPTQALAELKKEQQRLHELARQYADKAQKLRREEEQR